MKKILLIILILLSISFYEALKTERKKMHRHRLSRKIHKYHHQVLKRQHKNIDYHKSKKQNRLHKKAKGTKQDENLELLAFFEHQYGKLNDLVVKILTELGEDFYAENMVYQNNFKDYMKELQEEYIKTENVSDKLKDDYEYFIFMAEKKSQILLLQHQIENSKKKAENADDKVSYLYTMFVGEQNTKLQDLMQQFFDRKRSHNSFEERYKIIRESITRHLPPEFCYKKFVSEGQRCNQNYPHFIGFPLNKCYEKCQTVAKKNNIEESKVFENYYGTCVETCDKEWPKEESITDVSKLKDEDRHKKDKCADFPVNKIYTDWEGEMTKLQLFKNFWKCPTDGKGCKHEKQNLHVDGIAASLTYLPCPKGTKESWRGICVYEKLKACAELGYQECPTWGETLHLTSSACAITEEKCDDVNKKQKKAIIKESVFALLTLATHFAFPGASMILNFAKWCHDHKELIKQIADFKEKIEEQWEKTMDHFVLMFEAKGANDEHILREKHIEKAFKYADSQIKEYNLVNKNDQLKNITQEEIKFRLYMTYFQKLQQDHEKEKTEKTKEKLKQVYDLIRNEFNKNQDEDNKLPELEKKDIEKFVTDKIKQWARAQVKYYVDDKDNEITEEKFNKVWKSVSEQFKEFKTGIETVIACASAFNKTGDSQECQSKALKFFENFDSTGISSLLQEFVYGECDQDQDKIEYDTSNFKSMDDWTGMSGLTGIEE